MDDADYVDNIPATADITDNPDILDGIDADQVDAITDDQTDTPISPTLSTDDTIQTLSDNPPCPSTTPARKVDSRPSGVQGKHKKKAVKAGNTVNQTDSVTLPVITIKQRMYVQALTDPQSPTYGNQTQSYKSVYGVEDDNIAASNASRLQRRDKVHSWIEEVLKRNGVGIQARVAETALIIQGKAIRTRTKDVWTKGGKVTLTEQVIPTFADSLKGIDIINKMDGTYAKAAAAGNLTAQAEYDDLMSRTFSQDRARTARADRAKDVTVGQGDDGGEGLRGGA